MPEYTVTSEIYTEFDYKTNNPPTIPGNVISEFPFRLPQTPTGATYDDDDDLDIERHSQEVITIEHAPQTALRLVGLQVWRGAFLLADLLVALGSRGELRGRRVLELGAGTGVGSFVAALYAASVLCTDIDVGGILNLIKLNAKYNSKHIKSEFKVRRLDFREQEWSAELTADIGRADIVLAADVVYDDDITAAFVSTVQRILNLRPPTTLYMALEKRYVFTVEHLESVAPCYETFLALLDKVKGADPRCDWTAEEMVLDFPKYFEYDRVKELVLWRISSKSAA